MQSFFRNIVKWLVYSNLWVGLAVAAFCYLTVAHAWHINYNLLVICGAGTVAAYNYMRLVQLRYYSPVATGYKSWARSRPFLLATLTGFFGALALFSLVEMNRWEVVYLLAPAAIVALVYPLSFRSAFSGFTSLRSVAGLKLFLIAISWSYVTVILPAALEGILTNEVLLEALMRCFLIVALIIPFDIRDLPHDDPSMRTIPQVLGIEGAKELSLFFLLLYQLWIVLRFFFFDYPLPLSVALFAGVEVAYFLFLRIRQDKSEWFYSFWIEGIPVFTALLVLLFHWLFQAAA